MAPGPPWAIPIDLPTTPEAVVLHIARAFGYLEDVADDSALPAGRTEIETYWVKRQPEIVRSLDWLTGLQGQQERPQGHELSRWARPNSRERIPR